MSTSNMTKEQFKRYLIKRIAFWLVVIAFLMLSFSPFAWYMVQRVEARQALREAKNVQLAIKLLSTESFGNGQTLYDERTATGLNETYLEEVRKYSSAEGDITVTRWNSSRDQVQAFHYKTGAITVYFTYDFSKEKAEWKAEYCLPLLELKQ